MTTPAQQREYEDFLAPENKIFEAMQPASEYWPHVADLVRAALHPEQPLGGPVEGAVNRCPFCLSDGSRPHSRTCPRSEA